MTTRRP